MKNLTQYIQESILSSTGAGSNSIVMSNMIKYLKDRNVDVILAGHAHGGQFRIPFVGGAVAPNQGLFPQYDAGIYTEKQTNMMVSRGIGNSIIPIRFNNRPEVILIELKSN